jgi:hypothetical protein
MQPATLGPSPRSARQLSRTHHATFSCSLLEGVVYDEAMKLSQQATARQPALPNATIWPFDGPCMKSNPHFTIEARSDGA